MFFQIIQSVKRVNRNNNWLDGALRFLQQNRLRWLLFALAGVNLPVLLSSQEWSKIWGHPSIQQSYAECDGNASQGWYVVGNGYNSVNNSQDLLLARYSSGGGLIWQKWLGGSGNDAGLQVKVTPDGGCVFAGYSEISNEFWTRTGFVGKVSADGTLEWTKELGSSLNDVAVEILVKPTGYYFAIHSQISYNDQGVGLFRLAPDGVIIDSFSINFPGSYDAVQVLESWNENLNAFFLHGFQNNEPTIGVFSLTSKTFLWQRPAVYSSAEGPFIAEQVAATGDGSYWFASEKKNEGAGSELIYGQLDNDGELLWHDMIPSDIATQGFRFKLKVSGNVAYILLWGDCDPFCNTARLIALESGGILLADHALSLPNLTRLRGMAPLPDGVSVLVVGENHLRSYIAYIEFSEQLLVQSISHGQSGLAAHEQGFSLLKTNDGGLLVAGIKSPSATLEIFKLDESGEVEWGHSLAEGKSPFPGALAYVGDGYIVAYWNNLEKRIGFQKITLQGILLWQKEYPFEITTSEPGIHVKRRFNNQFLCLAPIAKSGSGAISTLLAMSSIGDTLYTLPLKGINGQNAAGHSLIIGQDANWLVGGNSLEDKACVIKISSITKLPVWQYSFTEEGSRFTSLVEDTSGFISAYGYTEDATRPGYQNALFAKLDSNGQPVYVAIDTTDGNKTGRVHVPDGAGGYYFAGNIQPNATDFNLDYQYGYLQKVDSTGSLKWEHAYGTGKSAQFRSAALTNDNGVALLGSLLVNGDWNYYLVKVDGDGATSIIDVPDFNFGFELWPNPASESLFLRNTREKNLTNFEWEIVNAAGGRILFGSGSAWPSQGELELNVAHLPDGVYFLQIIADGITFKRIWMKQ